MKFIVVVLNLSDVKMDELVMYFGLELWMRFSVFSSTTAYTFCNFCGVILVDFFSNKIIDGNLYLLIVCMVVM